MVGGRDSALETEPALGLLEEKNDLESRLLDPFDFNPSSRGSDFRISPWLSDLEELEEDEVDSILSKLVLLVLGFPVGVGVGLGARIFEPSRGLDILLCCCCCWENGPSASRSLLCTLLLGSTTLPPPCPPLSGLDELIE